MLQPVTIILLFGCVVFFSHTSICVRNRNEIAVVSMVFMSYKTYMYIYSSCTSSWIQVTSVR